MVFFQPESTQALSTFVRQFQHGPTYEKNILSLIEQFAGGDDVGEVINNLVLRYEGWFVPEMFPTFKDDSRIIGRIRGNRVQIWVKGEKPWHRDYLPEDKILVQTSAVSCGWGRLKIAETTVRDFDRAFLRKAIIACLVAQYANMRCKYCDHLVIEDGPCSECLETIGADVCTFCHSACGCMEHKRLKRGRDKPTEHYHEGCKKRKLLKCSPKEAKKFV